MRVVVIGAGGLLGRRFLAAVHARECEVHATPSQGDTSTATRKGLMGALRDADALVDLSQPICWHEPYALERYERSAAHLVSVAYAAHVRHHIAVSAVGADRLMHSAYFGALRRREARIEASLLPHTILRSTQLFEDLDDLDRFTVSARCIRVAPACVRPVEADEVAAKLVDLVLSRPRGTLEIAGPERLRLNDVVRRSLDTTGDARRVVTDAAAPYLGSSVPENALLPDERTAIIAHTRFSDWLQRRSSGGRQHHEASGVRLRLA